MFILFICPGFTGCIHQLCPHKWKIVSIFSSFFPSFIYSSVSTSPHMLAIKVCAQLSYNTKVT